MKYENTARTPRAKLKLFQAWIDPSLFKKAANARRKTNASWRSIAESILTTLITDTKKKAGKK